MITTILRVIFKKFLIYCVEWNLFSPELSLVEIDSNCLIVFGCKDFNTSSIQIDQETDKINVTIEVSVLLNKLRNG